MLDVGETALALSFFFLILWPTTGAELSASRNPVHSIAVEVDIEGQLRSYQE